MTRAAKPIVIALGGNAISPPDAEGNIPQQFESSRRTAARLVDLVEAGYRLVITHGNGPQVGNVLRRVELAAHEIYPLPLETCVADTQGGMGYMIAQCLNNELRRRGIARTASAIVTCVEVEANDPAFTRPSKPIGRTHSRERAAEYRTTYGWELSEVAPGEFRRVVPSPRPVAIVEIDLIRRLADSGELLIVAGGGGIPVARSADGDLVGVEAVIDKDLTSGLLAREIGSELLLIATGVERVALEFGKPAQRWLARLSVAEAKRHMSEGQFAAGSMLPKIEAAVEFLEGSAESARVLICELNRMTEALAGAMGTWIVPDEPG